MPRKIFISFLGVSNYSPVRYFSEKIDDALPPLRFVQEATIQLHCNHFEIADVVLVCTTPTAFKMNWQDFEHADKSHNTTSLKEGLESRLAKLNLSCKVRQKDIPEGKSPHEIWEIFNVVFNELEDYDRVTFDITHSFRSLPMLNMVLINYSKLLKNITVEGIYYGAFESKETNKTGDICSPIWNLNAFSEIQNWTNNARIFLKTGNALPLAEQITSPHYQEIKKSLVNFSQYTFVNRGMDIFSGSEMVNLQYALSQPIVDDDPALTALLPILDKIKEEFQFYRKDEVYNGFHAVSWCIQNGLLQQAATLMEEFITTLVMLDLGEQEFDNHNKRITISAALTLGKDQEFRFVSIPDEDVIEMDKKTKENIELRNWQENIVPLVRSYKFKKEFGDLSNKIKSSIRNDINHAGFRMNPREYSGLNESLVKRYKEIQKLLKRIKGIELPNLKNK